MATHRLRRTVAIALIAGVVMSAPSHADDLAAFANHAEASSSRVDHRALEQYLDAFAVANSGRTQIAYSVADGRGHAFLEQYITLLGRMDPTTVNRNEQLAYWLNLRNAMVIDLVSEAKSPRRLGGEIGTAQNPGAAWVEPRVSVSGQALSIQDVEAILFRNWNNPNLIYGLYQGTKDGARLPRAPFSGETVNETLEELGRDFVGTSTMGRVRRGTLELAPVYERYGDAAFGGDQAAMLSHVQALASGRFAKKLDGISEVSFRKSKHRGEVFTPRAARAPINSGGGGFSGGS
ncbi:MAG: DUF547 domain-containing protein [Pseudomonadota bacterium]